MEFDVAKRLITLRKLKGLSTNKLALQAGVTQSFLRDIELGRKKPTVTTLSLLCDELGISLKDFFDDELSASMKDDPLLKEIYRLSPKQREKLTEFLKLI